MNQKNYLVRLRFVASKKGEIPAGPIMAIYDARHQFPEKDGCRFLTPECASVGELEYWADEIISELKEIKKQARKKDAAFTKMLVT